MNRAGDQVSLFPQIAAIAINLEIDFASPVFNLARYFDKRVKSLLADLKGHVAEVEKDELVVHWVLRSVIRVYSLRDFFIVMAQLCLCVLCVCASFVFVCRGAHDKCEGWVAYRGGSRIQTHGFKRRGTSSAKTLQGSKRFLQNMVKCLRTRKRVQEDWHLSFFRHTLTMSGGATWRLRLE